MSLKNISAFLLILTVLAFSAIAQDDAEGEPKLGQTGGGTDGFALSGALGSTTINGESYQYFSLRPDIPLWKFGIGLDLSFYFDADGKLREEDWDQGEDYIDKIYYIRYGRPGQPLYIRAGSLSPITLGYGIAVRRYTNAIEWPQVRRIGLQTEMTFGDIKLEGLVNNFREIDAPGFVGGRLSYTLNLGLPVIFGGSYLYDGNQYLGAKDEDDDGIPDKQDMFPGDKDNEKITRLENLIPNQQVRQDLIDEGFIPDIHNPPDPIDERDADVTEFCLDVGVPIIQSSMMNLWLYAQWAQIADYGNGITAPGVMWTFGPVRASAEYRIFGEEFMSDFFNYSYEVERVTWDNEANTYVTKGEKLAGIPASQGFYADAGADFWGYLDLFAAYQQMKYEEGELPNKSFYATANWLKTDLIPRIDLIEGYYSQPYADKLFSNDSDGTTIGYRIGAAMGGGVMMVYDYKTIYYNGEPNKIMTIETVIKFK